MKPVVAAAVYARISSDDGSALGVTRQVKDCNELASQLGWTVAEEYIDNDVSAYSGKARPAYERMLADLAAGVRDAVIVYHSDRLTRRPIELEHFVEVVNRAGVRHVRFVSGGEFDVANGDGLMVLRLLAAVAANESASKSRRMKRKNDERAEAGLPHSAGIRPFGYAADYVTVVPDEAAVVRELVARFIAGESLRSLAQWLNDSGVRPVRGGEWRTPTLRTILRSGRIAGLREHRGEVIGDGTWEAIITPADRDRVLARMDARQRSGRRAPQSYLLSGLCRCGKCGGKLFSSVRQDTPERRTRRYVCLRGPDHGGCGRLTVVAPPLEELITAAVLLRLDSPELADAMSGRAAADAATAAMAEEIAGDKEQLDELGRLYAGKSIGAREWMAARNPIQQRVEVNERRLAQASGSNAVAGLVGNGERLGVQWADLGLDRQHAIVSAVLDHVVIGPGVSGARGLDPGRVDPVWRL